MTIDKIMLEMTTIDIMNSSLTLTLKRVRNDLCLERVWRRKSANLRRLPSPPKSNRRHFESATADEKSFF
jgi:hypothetical protein